ncbi:unnamed protein product, partial [Amoebophrya sp. A120]
EKSSQLPANIWRPEFNFHLLEMVEKKQAHHLLPPQSSSHLLEQQPIPPGPQPMFFSKDRKVRDLIHMTVDCKLLSIDLLDGNARNREALRNFPFDSFKFDFVVSMNGA